MVDIVDVLILANSVKGGARCVAGIRLDTAGWFRPVTDTAEGAISKDICRTDRGGDSRFPTTVRMGVQGPVPEPHQPENYLIEPAGDWEVCSHSLGKRHCEVLGANLQRDGKIFGTANTSIHESDLDETTIEGSLTLIRPEEPSVDFNLAGNGPRIEFSHDGLVYDLPITVPLWKEHHDSGLRPDDIGLNFEGHTELYLVLSLGNIYEGRHYTLVAGLLEIDRRIFERYRTAESN